MTAPDQLDRRIAVVLFNLGGPDHPDAVQPFLFNLFNDPAIIGLPGPLRWLVARLISKRRAPIAREIYAQIGGKSPLLELTDNQARALEERLAGLGTVKIFVAMRYWHPFVIEAAERVRDFGADEIVLLPLYPQFSTTTTGSSFKEWRRAAAVVGLADPGRAVCCYPDEIGWITAQASLMVDPLRQASKTGSPRVLFSAHGLPKKIVDKGDPYPLHVERTARAIVDNLKSNIITWPGDDWVVCYQSRVGPLEWIGPSTDDEIERAGRDGVPVVVVPLAFVSEHSETLVELDLEYAELATEKGVPGYFRVPTVCDHADYISGLASMVKKALAADGAVIPGADPAAAVCPRTARPCPYHSTMR